MTNTIETITEKLQNGNVITYKIIDGTAYDINTPEQVTNILERARKTGSRIRLFYGDTTTGRDWNEEYDTIGTIGRSTGRIKIPLLIKNSRSLGGGAILDNCIVMITENGRALYRHPKYYSAKFTVKEADIHLKDKGYTASVYSDNTNYANFKTMDQANRWLAFIQGKRNSK